MGGTINLQGQFSDFTLLPEFMSIGDCNRIQFVVWGLGAYLFHILTLPLSM